MKQLISVFLLCSMLLTGCSLSSERIREPVRFYYQRVQYEYGAPDGMIAWEERESSGHSHDLTYLMALYLMGPVDEDLVSPVPAGTRVYSITVEQDSVTMVLSDTEKTLSESGYSLVCACLALTAMEISGCNCVTIVSGERKVTMTPENLIQFDDSSAAVVEETQ